MDGSTPRSMLLVELSVRQVRAAGSSRCLRRASITCESLSFRSTTLEHRTYADALFAAMELHRSARGGEGWCAGVTDDPQRWLRDHELAVGRAGYTCVECASARIARTTAQILHLIEYEGTSEGGSDATVWVYVYALPALPLEPC